MRPYYIRPDGKVGHDAFAVIRETILGKVAIGRVVLTNREHIISLEPLDKGLMGTLLRYPYEVRSEDEYFDEIQDVKVTKDMLDLARHRQPEVGTVRAGQVRGSLLDRAGRSHQQQALRQADHAQGTSGRRQRRRPDGGAAPERRRCSAGKGVEARQEATQGGERSEGDADADRGQESQGDGGEEVGVKAAAQVGVVASAAERC
jgi:hypothetical protein